MVGVCGESWSWTPGLLSSNGETEALDSGPSSALPRPGAQRLTHSLTRQILDKRPPVRAPGTAQSEKTEVGKQCPTSQSIPGCGIPSPDVELRPRMWNSIPGCGNLSPDVELRPRMWNSIPGCGNLQLNCTRLGPLGGPVVKTSPSDAGRVGLIPPGGAGAAHALWPKKPRCRTEPIL